MSTGWIEAIDARSAAALATGSLQPVQAEQIELVDGGIRFIVRWVSSLATKDASAGTQADKADENVAIPGGPRDATFNPFLHPEADLTVGPIGEAHVAILNKFPLCARHLVLARRTFEEQLLPLTLDDFTALAILMREAGGLGLYNGGLAAGASQRHKHVQWIPSAPGNASLGIYAPGLPLTLPPQEVVTHPVLRMRHGFVRVHCGRGVPVMDIAASLHAGFARACEVLDMKPGKDGLLPPFNLLAEQDWLLLIPRSREHFADISMSAVCFGGTLYTRQREQIEAIRAAGPLAALAAVGY